MKVILTSFVAMLGFYVVPTTSVIDKHLASEDSAKNYLDCICCLPSGQTITAQALLQPQRERQTVPVPAPAPTLSPPQHQPQQSELVQAQPSLSLPREPLTLPQQSFSMNQFEQSFGQQLQSIPIVLASAGGGCGRSGGGGGEYYNYRRFGGRLRLRR